MTIQETKQSAKLKLKGCYFKCASATLLYFILVTIITYVLSIIQNSLQDHTIVLTMIEAIFAIISSVLSYGLIANVIAITNDKQTSITKFLDITISNFGKYVKIILWVLLKVLIPLAIFLLTLFYLFGTIIADLYNQNYLCFNAKLLPLAIIVAIIALCIFIYFLLKYILVAFIYNADSKKSAKEIVQESNKLMKKQKSKYILLLLSFFGWFILFALILAILGNFVPAKYFTPLIVVFYSLIRPYIIASEETFYTSLADDIK